MMIGGFVTPYVTVLLMGWLAAPVWHIRSLLIALPGLWIAIAIAVSASLRSDRGEKAPERRHKLRFAATMALLAGLAVWSAMVRPDQTRDRLFPVVRSFAEQARPGDALVLPPGRHGWGVTWYLDGPGRADLDAPLRERTWRLIRSRRMIRPRPADERIWRLERASVGGYRLLRGPPPPAIMSGND